MATSEVPLSPDEVDLRLTQQSQRENENMQRQIKDSLATKQSAYHSVRLHNNRKPTEYGEKNLQEGEEEIETAKTILRQKKRQWRMLEGKISK